MSQTAQGAGWWRASDGRFYPPELIRTRPTVGPPPPGPPAPVRQTNGFAIASLVLSLAAVGIGSILAVIFGVMARREIRASEGAQGGEGLATAGLVIGWVGLALTLLVVTVVVLVAVLVPHEAFATVAISGAPGYSTADGEHGLPLAQGHPWGRPCQPIVFQVDKAMPTEQYDLIAQAVESARSEGIDVAIETRNLYWYPSSLYPAGQTNASVRFVPILATTASPPPLGDGQMEHLDFGTNTRSRPTAAMRSSHISSTIYLTSVQGDPRQQVAPYGVLMPMCRV